MTDQPTLDRAALRALAEPSDNEYNNLTAIECLGAYRRLIEQYRGDPWMLRHMQVLSETIQKRMDTADRHAALVEAILRGDWNDAARRARGGE